MRKNIYCYCCFVIILLLVPLVSVYSIEKNNNADESLIQTDDEFSASLYAINASQYGVQYPETFVLMQNRMGVRIEYCIDRSNLQLWISPQAGKSMSYIDRNWSNRDDHTNIFDRILIPGLNLHNFIRCDWDPFHSVLYYQDQVLHIAQVYDQPIVLVWLEKPGNIDFKIFGTPVKRDAKNFIVNHTDRGREFQSAAIISPGQGNFQHQLVLDPNRSTYARAQLQPGQFLVIASELDKEQISKKARGVAGQPLESILNKNEQLIRQDLRNGQFKLRNRPEMQKLLDKSRRVALSMQDFKGFLRSTNQYIYYLLWYRDGGMNAAHLSYSGWSRPARDQVNMSLLNPNVSTEDPKGIYFGQTMSGEVTKWEEDGLFYVIWPTFAYWTQTGDDTFCKGEYLRTMQDAMNWLERYTYDEKKGLFGRYYFCENPMSYSRDAGWDNATGAPTDSMPSMYKGQLIIRGYDIYINMLNYSNYMMLSAMTSGEQAQSYYQKAMVLEEHMRKFFDLQDGLPSYGDLLTSGGKMITAAPYGMDTWDYSWALSLPPFTPNLPATWKTLREQVVSDMTSTKEGYFLCCYFAMLTSMDTQIHDEDLIMQAMDERVQESARPGKYLPMANAVQEMFNVTDGEPFHDVRPIVYSIAPWLSAVTNLGVRRMPFGIAVRGTKYLENIDHYKYRNGVFDIDFSGNGKIESVLLNGKPLSYTLQIPIDMINDGVNNVTVNMSASAELSNCLVLSTVELDSVNPDGDTIIYDIIAYGKNVLTFQNLDKQITILNAEKQPVTFQAQTLDDLRVIEFKGHGKFTVSLQ